MSIQIVGRYRDFYALKLLINKIRVSINMKGKNYGKGQKRYDEKRKQK